MCVHVYTTYVHGITNCLNRFSWPTQRCRCRGEGYPLALSCKGLCGSGQSLSRRWWYFLCQARCCRNRGGHQQVYQWPGEPGVSRFWQAAYIAKQGASSCRHKWQQDVAYCSFGRRLSSRNGWGTAEEVCAFWALIVQAHSGIQVNKYYIHVYTMHVSRWAMYTHCTYMLYTCIYKYMYMV